MYRTSLGLSKNTPPAWKGPGEGPLWVPYARTPPGRARRRAGTRTWLRQGSARRRHRARERPGRLEVRARRPAPAPSPPAEAETAAAFAAVEEDANCPASQRDVVDIVTVVLGGEEGTGHTLPDQYTLEGNQMEPSYRVGLFCFRCCYCWPSLGRCRQNRGMRRKGRVINDAKFVRILAHRRMTKITQDCLSYPVLCQVPPYHTARRDATHFCRTKKLFMLSTLWDFGFARGSFVFTPHGRRRATNFGRVGSRVPSVAATQDI
jgi:hypothetical protein